MKRSAARLCALVFLLTDALLSVPAHAQSAADPLRLGRALGAFGDRLQADGGSSAFGEFAPSLKLLNDHAGVAIRVGYAHGLGLTGRGVMVGVVDSGLDFAHADFRRADGSTRARWFLDYASEPAGIFPELEALYQVTIAGVKRGAVYSSVELDASLGANGVPPTDRVGHGTHVSGTAAANASSKYPGMAPDADLVVVRVSDPSVPGIDTANVLRGVKFVFDRASAEGKPAVANLSLGSDYGPHDGTLAWEQELAALVGPAHPGRVIVAAAGNSGRPGDGIHEQVYVARGSTTRVHVRAKRAGDGESSVYAWVRFRPGAALRVGLRTPDAPSAVALQGPGREAGYNPRDYSAAVVTSGSKQQIVPSSSPGAVVAWVGKWPSGDYEIELEGQGTADLFVSGDGGSRVGFYGGVRESTVGSPAANPDIIAVGASVNRRGWTSRMGAPVAVPQWSFDRGGELETRSLDAPYEGEVAAFSSAGPSTSGVPKPEVLAPGAGVISALSSGAPSASQSSIFYEGACPIRSGKLVAACFEVDATHALSFGTSMATPVVTGTVALLLQAEPTLSSDKIKALLQGGAHAWRTGALFHEQAGAGEVDIQGALAALSQMNTPALSLPSAAHSWLALSHAFAPATGQEPVTVLLELRNALGQPADLFGADRLAAEVRVESTLLPAPPLTRVGPGLYRYEVRVPEGHGGGETMTFGARFDGAPVVADRRIPIGNDPWRTFYGSKVVGACSMHASPASWTAGVGAAVAALALTTYRRRRK